MHESHLNSKVKEAEGLFNITPKAATTKSIKHLDFQLKEHEANLIRSLLPSQFLLINLKATDVEKIKVEYQVKIGESNPVKNKHETIESKKNEKKIETKQRKGNNLVMKKEKNLEKNSEDKEKEEQKSKSNHSLSQKVPGQEHHKNDREKVENLDFNPFGFISNIHPRHNMEGMEYEMGKNLIAKNNEYQHFGNYEPDRNGYEQKFEQNHDHFGDKIGEIPFEYPMYQPEHNNWMGYFSIPFLPLGEPRYNPEFFEPRPEETPEKNKLLHLFGLPFAESAVEHVQKLDELQKKFCLSFLNRLKSHKCSQIFRVAVNPEGQGIPDYYHIVYQPMDLATILRKVQKDKYTHIHEFHSDINKIIMNSYKYNLRETPYFITTVKFEDYYQTLLKEAKENPEEFMHDPQQRIAKLKKTEDNEFYDQAEFRKKKKVEQGLMHKNLEKGKKEKNETQGKSSKRFDENSQMFYNSMINESNDYSFPNENNLFNSISAENVKNKKNMTVHHRNMNIKKSQSVMVEGQNFASEQSRSGKNIYYEENLDELNYGGKGLEKLKHKNSSYEGKQKENEGLEKSREHEINLREFERKQKEEEEEYGDLGNFIFEIEQNNKPESENNKNVHTNTKPINSQQQTNFIKNKNSNSQIPIQAENYENTLNGLQIPHEEIKMKKGLEESMEHHKQNGENMESFKEQFEKQYEMNSKEDPTEKEKELNGKLFEHFDKVQIEVNASNKSIQKEDKLYASLKLSKAQSPSFQETTIQNPFQTYASSSSPPAMILADYSTQPYLKTVRKSKKKEIDEDYKVESEEEYVDNAKAKKTMNKQQPSLNNEESYSQEYSIPKNRKKISRKETIPLNEAKKTEPRPRKQQGNPQNEIQARIHAEMENFYKLPPIINVSEPSPAPVNFLPTVQEVSLNDQHSELNPGLPVPFHSNIFLDKEENNHPEAEQGIVDIMDLIS